MNNSEFLKEELYAHNEIALLGETLFEIFESKSGTGKFHIIVTFEPSAGVIGHKV